MRSTGTLYFFCGKMGAGKSTAAKRIVEEQRAVLLSEDEWLNALYPNQIKTFDDYLEYAKQMRPLVKQHVQHLLAVGVDVVMDFPANTKKQRKWFLDLVSEIDAHHQLIFLNRTNEQCLRQIAQRRQDRRMERHVTFSRNLKYSLLLLHITGRFVKSGIFAILTTEESSGRMTENVRSIECVRGPI